VYTSVRNVPAPPPDEARPARRRWMRRPEVTRNVYALGFTSLLTDISSESVSSIIPLYLTFQLGFTPLAFGVFDGVYQALASITALLGAALADRFRRHKEVAGAGYLMSALCKVGLLFTRSMWVPATGFLYLDRAGKGIRTAPRDALISLSSDRGHLGESFGVHRALDTVGALLGPLLAFALLTAKPGDYSTVIVASIAVGFIGVAQLTLFVRNAGARPADDEPRVRGVAVLRSLVGRRAYGPVLIAGFVLGAFTVSDALLYLTFQRHSSMGLQYFPLLPVGTSLVYLLLAVPLGRIADARGRRRIYLLGFALLGCGYLMLLTPDPGTGRLLGLLALMGAYYACTDGVLAAIASAALPESLRTSGIAVLNIAVSLGRLVSSLVFGYFWGRHGSHVALDISLIGLVGAIGVAAVCLRLPRDLARSVS
jgi:MFS family permease